ncbi:hypothetical protein [Rhodopirellula halodulae]|nr:hypothetical protein [Rhodopirellula sp. JC740]
MRQIDILASIFTLIVCTGMYSSAEDQAKDSPVEKHLARLGWLYSPNDKADADPQHTKIWQRDIHLDDDSFTTLSGGFLGIGSYESALSYYTSKIDKQLDIGEDSPSPIQGTSDAGSYIIHRLHKDGQPKRHRIVLRTPDADVVTELREYPRVRFAVSYGIRIVFFTRP